MKYVISVSFMSYVILTFLFQELMESSDENEPQDLIAVCQHQTNQLIDMIKDTSPPTNDCMFPFHPTCINTH